MDGSKISTDEAPNEITQLQLYNRWKHMHCVTSLLHFVPDETILSCFYNAPCCFDESAAADWERGDKHEVGWSL